MAIIRKLKVRTKKRHSAKPRHWKFVDHGTWPPGSWLGVDPGHDDTRRQTCRNWRQS